MMCSQILILVIIVIFTVNAATTKLNETTTSSPGGNLLNGVESAICEAIHVFVEAIHILHTLLNTLSFFGPLLLPLEPWIGILTLVINFLDMMFGAPKNNGNCS